MIFPTMLDDLAHMFAVLFGPEIVVLSGAVVAGSLLFSFSIVAVGLVRGRD